MMLHPFPVTVERGEERRPIRIPHAVGDPGAGDVSFRQALGLAIVDLLEAVLGGAQERVSAGQVRDRRRRQVSEPRQVLEDLEDPTGPEDRLPSPVDELKRLAYELDLPDPPGPCLMSDASRLRFASSSMRCFISRNAPMAPKSR